MNTDIAILRESIGKIVQMLAGMGLRVTQMGARAYVTTDAAGKPTRVNIPNLPDGASPELIMAIQGFIDHEVAHIFFTEFTIMGEAVKKGGKELGSYVNIVEDPRIERCMGKKFPGSLHNIERLHEFFFDQITLPNVRAAKTPEDKFNYLLVPVVRAWSGQKIFDRLLKEHGYWDQELVKALVDKMPPDLLKRMPALASTREALEIAEVINKILHPPKPPAPPAPPMPPPPPKPDKSDSDKSDDPDGEGSNNDKPEDDEDKGSGGEPTGEEKDEQEDGDQDDAGDADADDDDDEAGDPSEDGGDERDEETGGGKSPKKDKKDKDESEGSGDSGDEADPEDEEAGSDDDMGDGSGADDDNGDDESDAKGDADEGDDPSEEDDANPDASDEADEDSDGDDEAEEGSKSSEDGDEGDVGSSGKTPTELEEAAPSGEGHDSTEGSPFENVETNPRDFEESLETRIGDEASRLFRGADYVVFTREWDKIEKLHVPDERYKDDMLVKLDDDTSHMVGPMQKEIERMLAARSCVMKVGGYRSGRLNGSSLHRLKVNDDRVFSRKFETRATETSVMLLIDNSGSMGGPKCYTAMAAGYALSQTLERCRVPHEVMGFTTTWEKTEGIHKTLRVLEDEQKIIGRGFSRLEPLWMPIYKGFDERLTSDVKRRFAYMARAQAGLANNIDGECVEIAGRRLLQRKESRKVLLVLSDGSPSGLGNHRELVSKLHSSVEDLEKARVEVVGIGIMDASVRSFYKKHLVLKDIASLPATVMGELRRILLA